MTQNKDFKLPFNSLTNYIPLNLRNNKVTSLMDNLFNRFMTHDESVPLYGYAGRKPSSIDDRTPRIPQPDVERDVNAIIPVFNFKVGTEQHAFTVEDIIRKAEAIGVPPDNLQWLYSQGNNYLPPIDLDKFTNFFNYYWIAKSIPATPTLAWNPDLVPEYYVIAAPLPTDLNKLNVVAASTTTTVLTGSGFHKMGFVVEFTSPTTFKISSPDTMGDFTPVKTTFELDSNDFHVDYMVISSDGTKLVKLIEFDVVRELIPSDNEAIYTGFDTGDKFTIACDFLTRNYTVAFAGSQGVKGKIAKVRPLNTYQSIDGVLLKAGDRVLIKNASPDTAGIYIVSPGPWVRAADFDGDTRAAGAMIFVAGGTVNGGKMFVSITGGGGYGFQLAPVPPGGYQSNTNEWQEGNYWVSGERLSELGLARSDAVQAVRPIIEYSADVQLNGFVKNGLPSDSGTAYRQIKTEFSQLPLFDLFRYDGTHSNLVSSVFFYEEDMTASLDVKLQKRLAQSTNSSVDFIFNHGMQDNQGQMLFIKRNGIIKSIWHAGYNSPIVTDTTFDGVGNGTLANTVAKGFTQQQIWTLTAKTESTFEVTASKLPVLPEPFNIATVGQPYNNGEVSFTINAGTTAFVPGDVFMFSVGNLESPRYVHRDKKDAIFDRFGGPAADLKGEGTWQVPRTFYNNPYNDSRSPITEGVLYSHFRGILANQLGDKIDHGFGGSIKLWSEQQTLLASLLMQRDMTPISMIDLSQRQYETALNTVRDIFQQNIVQFIGDNGPITDYVALEKLLTFVQGIRSHDNDVKTVLYDTTSPLLGFPATLPQLGIARLVKPMVGFEPVLGRNVLTHHDGHQSVVFEDNLDLRMSILGSLTSLQVKRSDGTYTPALNVSATPPARPYKGELWQTPNGLIASFNVFADTVDSPPNPTEGMRWYNRSTGILSTWASATGVWIEQPSSDVCWVAVNFADTLNSLMLLVETRLYEGINPNSRRFDFSDLMSDPGFVDQIRKELFTFAAMNGYDPLGSDYDATDAFTWNYSSLGGAARWYNVLKNNQASVTGVIPTERPNLEPWKLLGVADANAWWTSLTPEKQAAYTPIATPDELNDSNINGGTVAVVQTASGITSLIGLQIIDGVALHAGDRVLLVNETSAANNGVWIAGSGSWSRAAGTDVPGTVFSVVGGSRKDTLWLVSQTLEYKQVRTWTDALWADVKLARPTLKLSVNTFDDSLLPPYVSVSSPSAADAITNTRPASASLGYEFGQGSPVETVWTRTLEHGYSLARALFRYDPLAFLGFCWGFNWVDVDGVLYDGVDMNMPGHKRFRLHGDLLDPIVRDPLVVTGNGSVILKYDAYVVRSTGTGTVRAQNFSVWQNGVVIGYVEEGVPATIGGVSFTITDKGQPFRIGDRYEIANGVAIFVPTPTNIFLGFGQTFTNALRETSIDTKSSFAVAAYRQWEVNMGYRVGGLVATDDLQIYTDNETLSASAYNLVFKKNQIAMNEWMQALRISVTNFGATVPRETGVAPKDRGADWVFRIEGYNPRYNRITYYTMSDVDQITFNALNKQHTDLEWFHRTNIADKVTTDLPLSITGVQNVINFLFGYAAYLESRGWNFEQHGEFNIDAETGRSRNFQLEIEKFVDRCYAGISEGQGHVVNPFIERAWFNQSQGMMSEFIDTSLFDITGHPGAFDTLGVKFKKDDLEVTRSNELSSVAAAGPMFSVHIQLDEFEHLFIFNNFTQPSTESGMLYDPFSGARVVTYKFNGRKQATNTMRPEFGGHFLVGNEVHQNLQASTDNIANLYDANHVFENEKTSRHALALLGFNRKQYFDNLDISEKTQFNFWRGLIQSKGTNLSVGAYLNSNRFEDAKIDEYWAYKLAEYGDARQHSYPEMKLTVNDALTQFTKIQFDSDTLASSGFETVNHFDEHRWFSIDDMNQDVTFAAEIVGNFSITDADTDKIYELPFIADMLVPGQFEQINATTIKPLVNGDLNIVGYGPARPRFNPVKVFNYDESELVAEIPVWHPAAGQHTPSAMETINIISDINPARFNYSNQVVNNTSFDPLRPWGDNEVGRVWLDTRNLAYLPYYDSTENAPFPTVDERLSRWGTLADFATVDVYEWVKSTVPPSEYDALAAEQAGDASLNSQTKAAGQVADQQTYMRERNWSMRPIAWSFSEVPRDVDWGATPPFPGGSTDAHLSLQGGYAILDRGTFAEYGILAGMHLGAWNNDPADPKPLSEYLIENTFTKKIRDIDGGDFQPTPDAKFSVDLGITAPSDVSGQLFFSFIPKQQTEIVKVADSWEVTTFVKVTDAGSGKFEIAKVSSAIGNDGGSPEIVEIPDVPYLAEIVERQYRPANPGQPYIKHVEGQPYLPAKAATPATSGTQSIRFNPGLSESTSLTLAVGDVVQTTIDGINRTFTATEADKNQITTVKTLLTTLNSLYSSEPFSILGGNLVVTSPTVGQSSKVVINNFTVFTKIPGFDTVLPSVDGFNKVPEFLGQEFIEHVEGQEFIPYDAGQSYVSPRAEQLFVKGVSYAPAVSAGYLFGAEIVVEAGQVISVDFNSFGLSVQVTCKEDGVLKVDEISKAIAAQLSGRVVLNDAALITTIVESLDTDLSNDLVNPLQAGWRVWNVPTQAQLDADGQPPVSSWKPYAGDYASIDGNFDEIQNAVAYALKPLTLKNGVAVNRYETTWADWTTLKNEVLTFPKNDELLYEAARDGDVVTFTNNVNFEATSTSVYVNGIAQLKASFTLSGKQLSVKGVRDSSKVTVIIRKYEPTIKELAFDPAVADDLSFQRQYKRDYEYVSLPVRDSEGSLSSTIYFFWVKNKTTPALGKKQSVQAVAQQLREGPANFLTFQNLLFERDGDGTETIDPANESATGPYRNYRNFRYDAIAISGLSYVVTKDDAFKLRFTRNFTLRDDPEELNLKNVHTEWALMRPGQKIRVPESLWLKLTDSVVGEDIGGNVIPAIRRVLYDERNNTRTQFGFGSEQTLAPAELLRSSIIDSIVNTKLLDESSTTPIPDYITFLDFDRSDEWFATPAAARQTMTAIWNQAKVAQINEVFFAALNDVLASNYELSDIFKTSRISAYSIKVVNSAPIAPTFE